MLVLASKSPRRRQLLETLGLTFSVIPSTIPEHILPGESAKSFVERLSCEKARSIVPGAGDDQVVLAADTIVVHDGQVLGKPADAQEAGNMLLNLRGTMHQVYTGLALINTSTGRLVKDVCKTDVYMRDYSLEEMNDYIASGDPLDKAGAYAVQHDGFHPVEKFSGCYTNIIGLPLCRAVKLFTDQGIPVPINTPYPCLSGDEKTCSFIDMKFAS